MQLSESAHMPPGRIQVRSRRQAMDWSLVLVSQGIESVIEREPESGWCLRVHPEEEARAMGILRQYRLENAGWGWRHAVVDGVMFDWGSLPWAILLLVFYWVNAELLNLRQAGLMDAAAVSNGQWWRLFTAMYLHADLGHLIGNVGFGALLLGLTMGAYGTGAGLLAAYLAGAAGNLLTWGLDPTHRSLGASGMVMACVGMLAVHSISIRPGNPRVARSVVAALGGGFMLFLLVGSGPGTDLEAHLGGFAAGIVLGLVLKPFRAGLKSARLNLGAGVIFVLLTVVPWYLALRHAGLG